MDIRNVLYVLCSSGVDVIYVSYNLPELMLLFIYVIYYFSWLKMNLNFDGGDCGDYTIADCNALVELLVLNY